MVSHKVLKFGDDGYKLPAQARAPRSVRVNGPLLIIRLAVTWMIRLYDDHLHFCSHFARRSAFTKRRYQEMIRCARLTYWPP